MNRAVNRNERNINVCTVLIAATLLLLCSITLISRIQKLNTDQEWDILLFVQRWPNTACMEWEEKDGKNCTLPKKSGHWTIHGVWPTKLGTKGPTFCNGSLPFNDTALDDIKDDLNEYWTDVELGGKHKKDGFWRHEWVKHGTCASALETLNSEEKYFKQALAWLNDYNMMQVLMFEQIHPTKTAVGYDAVSIAKAVNDAVGKNPFIHCVHDTKTRLPFLSEIRLCFDKNLVLIDCDGTKVDKRNSPLWQSGSVLTNCPKGKLIMYPSNVPPKTRRLAPVAPEPSLLNLYKCIVFLQWFTS